MPTASAGQGSDLLASILATKRQQRPDVIVDEVV
jgi:hypothetical protein